MSELKEKYKKVIIPAMMAKFGYKSQMSVPRIEKVVLNSGFGKMVSGKTSKEQEQIVSGILNDLTKIAGQKVILIKAKKAISGFKLRQGAPVGGMVSLRRNMMYDFLERLINITLPRSRDFQGIDPDSFDKNGNFTIAIKEHIVFPEISPEQTRNIFGLEITVVSNAKSRQEGQELLRLIGFPFKKTK